MAAIKGLTEAQNNSLTTVEVGNLVLVDQVIPYSEDEDEDEEDPSSDSDEDSDDSGSSDSEDDSSDSDGEVASGAQTPRAPQVQATTPGIVDPDHAEHDHAEHIEDADHADLSVPTDMEDYRTLDIVEDGQRVEGNAEFHPVTVYLVVKISKDADGTIQDLSLVPLKYSSQCDDSAGTFQLYGKQCVPSSAGKIDQSSQLGNEHISICDLPGGETLKFTISPDGDHVRCVVFDHECPACDQGWLPCITELNGMVKDYTIPSAQIGEPAVCPSCIGIDLMKEHQELRAELEAFQHVSDFGAIHAFHGRLVLRRRELEYDFEQFDERRWGYLFDDMLSDDEAGGDDGRYEEWDEASDPSTGATLHPASDATIKSLPVKKYAEIKTDDEAQCVVCREKFEDEQLIMQLPCKHFFCEDGCTVQWLKQHDTCPVCRARVPPVKEVSGNDSGHEDVEAVGTTTDDEQEEQEATANRAAETDRDNDVTMLDV